MTGRWPEVLDTVIRSRYRRIYFLILITVHKIYDGIERSRFSILAVIEVLNRSIKDVYLRVFYPCFTSCVISLFREYQGHSRNSHILGIYPRSSTRPWSKVVRICSDISSRPATKASVFFCKTQNYTGETFENLRQHFRFNPTVRFHVARHSMTWTDGSKKREPPVRNHTPRYH